MPTAMFNTQNTIGIREDLSNVLTNISPTETPFFSSLKKAPISGTYSEWQTMTLADAAVNAAVEGASAVMASGNTTTRMGNRTQIFQSTVMVSNTTMSVNLAGRANEWALQMDAKSKQIARDIEYALITSSAQAAGDVSGDTARSLEGLGLNSNQNATAGFASSNVTTLLTTASDTNTRKNLTETYFNDMLQTIWTAGGKPDVIYVGAYNKRVISAFSANQTRFKSVDMGQITLRNTVDVYESDFGIVKLVANRYVNGTTLCAIETNYWAVGELRPATMTRLAKDGDRERAQLVTELTLLAYAPTSSGKIIGIASAAGATT